MEVDLSGYLDNTDTQDLSLSDNTLSLTDGGSVDLSGYLDDTDTTYTAGTGLTLIDTEFSVDLGTTIETGEITNGTIVNDDISESTTISASKVENGSYFIGSAGTAGYVWKSDGDGVGTWGEDIDTDTQDLSLSDNTLSLTDGGSVDLSGYLDNTDTQDLSLSENTLSLTDGGSVDLSGYLDNTDTQDLTGFVRKYVIV